MKYNGWHITMNEMPGWIALAYSITECPLRCKSCHSPELQTSVGHTLSTDVIIGHLKQYPQVDGIILMGHGSSFDDLPGIVDVVRAHNKMICVYTGLVSIPDDVYELLDYIKIGPYVESRGGLNSPHTNQRMVDCKTKLDVTHKFSGVSLV